MRRVHRRTGAAFVAVWLLILLAASSASADVTGQVTTPSGGPLQSASLRVTDAAGALVTTRSTDASGRYTVPTASLAGRPAPPLCHLACQVLCFPASGRLPVVARAARAAAGALPCRAHPRPSRCLRGSELACHDGRRRTLWLR